MLGLMTFLEKLRAAVKRNGSLLCIGLDPDPKLMAIPQVAPFNRAIIEATADLVCAYKPNLAFYEALGREGMEALEATLSFIPPFLPVIGDAKRGDVGHSAQAYARALFSRFSFDAVTVNPYLGYDSVEPFLDYKDKGVFLLCRTSNPGAADFQSLPVSASGSPPLALYEVVALKAQEWNRYGNIGLVVGATFPQELRRVRELCPHLPLLVPGLGAQGGEVELSVRYGQDERGEGLILTSSRGVIYASRGQDFAAKAREEASKLRELINRYRPGPIGN